jgi:hypothetical protein
MQTLLKTIAFATTTNGAQDSLLNKRMRGSTVAQMKLIHD